jgi:hypothetical protein
MEKTIYELRKQVKDLQNKMAMNNGTPELVEEDRSAKNRKK